jgi:copper transport protein
MPARYPEQGVVVLGWSSPTTSGEARGPRGADGSSVRFEPVRRRRLFLGAMLAALAVVAVAAAWIVVDPGSGTALAIARAVRLIATGAVTGLLVLLIVVWRPLRRAGTVDDAPDEVFVRVGGRALRWFAVLGAVGAAAAVPLLAADGPGDLLDALGSRVGVWLAVSAPAFAAVAGFGPAALRRDGDGPRTLGAVVLLVALLNVAPAFGGHSAVAPLAALLVLIEIVHVVGMGAWVGGLVGLLLVLPPAARALPAGPARTRLLAAVLLRFSPVALTAVVVLTLAGTALSLLSLTTLYDLADTAYGRAVFVKIVLLLVAITLAVLQREYLVPQLERAVAAGDPAADPDAAKPRGLADGPPREPDVAARHVRAALRGEALLLIAVLIVTGALAGYPTPKSLADRPATVTQTAAGFELRLVVAPARVGDNVMRLTVRDAQGRPAAGPRLLRIRALPPGRAGSSDVPVEVRATAAGTGRWVATAVPLGARGRWKLVVELAGGQRGRVTATLPVRVR